MRLVKILITPPPPPSCVQITFKKIESPALSPFQKLGFTINHKIQIPNEIMVIMDPYNRM
jgi:hypothetical protein